MTNFPLKEAACGLSPEMNDQTLDRFLSYITSTGLTLYSAQEEAILEIFSDNNVILKTPTGSGKSLVALALHFKSFVLQKQSIYTCPIKALVNEKFLALCSLFGPESVGMITGDGTVNREAPILCCTAEILANMALREGAQCNVAHIIMDEFHYYADKERGIAWQIPLLTLPNAQFLLMSATMGESLFFEECLSRLTGKRTVTVSSEDRPVPLFFEYSDSPLELTLESLLASKKYPVYIVHFTQRECAETAQALLSTNFCSAEEKKAIATELIDVKFSSPYGKEVNRILRHGIGIHHGGLLPRYRSLVERLSQKGLLKMICGTDTLGVGVNVPIRTVLFTKLCKYDGTRTGLLSARDFHQICGRAGRKGFDTTGYVVAQAPLHVIENTKMEAKIAKDPSKAKKFVRKKPPEKDYVSWTEETFKNLIAKSPEKLTSQFSISHGMLLNVLSRKENGCKAMQKIIRSNHSDEKEKRQQFKLAFKFFRALLERKIIEIVDPTSNNGSHIRVNVTLQDDFSLDHELSLYLIDSLKRLDPLLPDYALDIVTQIESILENPQVILRKQLDKLKTKRMAELKAEGVEFDDRIAELDQMEYTKPNHDFVYNTFNEFVGMHPWLTLSNIRPKSIAREMHEEFYSFAEYTQAYGIQRSEGILLRYLSQFYKTLIQNIPEALRTEQLEEIILYFGTMLRGVDSSLLDEWEKMKNPGFEVQPKPEDPTADLSDITRNHRAFNVIIRGECMRFLRCLSLCDYNGAVALLRSFAVDEKISWNSEQLREKMSPYYTDHERLRFDHKSRSPQFTLVTIDSQKKFLQAEIIFVDDQDFNDWHAIFSIDHDASATLQRPILELKELGPIG